MKKPSSILIALIIWPVSLFGQTGHLHADSLLVAAKNHNKPDSVKATMIIEAGAALIGVDYNKALALTEEGLALSEKIGWKRGIVSSYRQLGAVYQSNASLLKAIEFTQKALLAGKEFRSKELDASLNLNLGIMYNSLKDFTKAFDHMKKAMTLYNDLGSKEGEAITALNFGVAYLDSKINLDSAIYFSNKSYLYGLSIGNDVYMAYSLGNMGLAYNKKGMLDSAISSLEKSGELGKKTSNTMMVVQALLGQAEAYKNKNYYLKAEALLQESLNIQKEKGIIQYQGDSYKLLSEILNKTGKHEKALNAFENYVLMRDSVLNDEKRQEVVRLEEKYEYDKKEAILTATHDAEIKQQQTVQYALAGGTTILIAAGIISFIFYKRNKEAASRRKEAELQTEIANTEMKALRSQMNPHFIFNALNSIADYMRKNDIPNADNYLAKFARLMRMVLENSEKKEVPLADDLQALELYMQLEAMRSGQKFTYEIKVDEGINLQETYVPPLLLQPFVENSIWHGIAHKKGQGKITLRVSRDAEGMLSCTVEDDGVGRQHAASIEADAETGFKKSLGMRITGERIALLNKIKDTKGGVSITDLPQGLRVEVKMPMEVG